MPKAGNLTTESIADKLNNMVPPPQWKVNNAGYIWTKIGDGCELHLSYDSEHYEIHGIILERDVDQFIEMVDVIEEWVPQPTISTVLTSTP